MQSTVEEKVRKALGVLEQEKIETPSHLSTNVLARFDEQSRIRRRWFLGQLAAGLSALLLLVVVDPVPLYSGKLVFRKFWVPASEEVLQSSLMAVRFGQERSVQVRVPVGAPVRLQVVLGPIPSGNFTVEMDGIALGHQVIDGMLTVSPSVRGLQPGVVTRRIIVTSEDLPPVEYLVSIKFE